MAHARRRAVTRATLALLCPLCLLAGCGRSPAPASGDSGTPAKSETRTDPPTPPASAYADIGDGTFSLERETYYASVGRSFRVKGQFDFDEPDDVPLTITADDPEAIEASPDGTVSVRKAGDFSLTVREEKYGTSATCRLSSIGNLRDNIIVSVPVWRGKWSNPEQFAYMKDAGVDLVVAVTGIENRDYTVSRSLLDEALRTWSGGTGLRALVHSAELTRPQGLDDRELEGIVQRFRDCPALAGYHLIDEPGDANPYAAAQNRFGLLDPDSLTDVNFFPGAVFSSMTDYEHRLNDYCQILDDRANAYLSFDNYPFGPEPGSVNEDHLFGNFEAVRRAGLRNGVRTAFYVQAVGGFGNSYRRPDRAQLTYHLSSALAYGFKWIKYWSWFVPDYGEDPEATTYPDYTDAIIGKDGRPTDLYEVARELHARVHTIGPILVDCEADEVYHTGRRSASSAYTLVPPDFFAQPDGNEYAILSLLCSRRTGRQYLMVVNKDIRRPAEMRFTLRGAEQVAEIDALTGERREVALPDHQLRLSLNAGDFAFFELPEGDFRTKREAPPASGNLALSASRVRANASVGRDGWFIGCAADGRRGSEDEGNRGWRVPERTEGAITFSFDQPVTVNRVDLYPAGEGATFGCDFPQSVRILAADAGAPGGWTELYADAHVARPTTETPVIRFDPVTTSAVRLVIGSAAHQAELAEIEIYHDDGSVPPPPPTSYRAASSERNVNYALGKRPIASGSAYESLVDAWGLAYLNDGSKLQVEQEGGTNGWMSQPHETRACEPGAVWGGVDLSNVYLINEIRLYPRQSGAFFPSAYEVQVSEDGTNYTTVYTAENDTETRGVARVIRLDSEVKARFVRVTARYLTGSIEFGGYIMQLSEIEVYRR